MSQNVTQWLEEIKSLKQQLAEAHQEREQAYASAANWQRLYETEAQQRRTEITLARQMIEDLRVEIQQVRGKLLGEDDETALTEIRAEVEQLQTVEDLREKLLEALAERDRLTRALKTEQANHIQTRKSLTIALGDAIDMLAKKQSDPESH